MTEEKRVGGIIISHGNLANELLAAAQTVVGDLKFLTSVSIGWNDEVEAAREQIAKAIKEVAAGGGGVIILTDMFGGTPTNIAAMFMTEGEIEIITGVNLPMVIKLASQSAELPLDKLAKEIEEQGKQSIQRASELLVPKKVSK